MKKRSMSTLSSTSSTCGSFRYCGSVLPVVVWCLFCRCLMSPRTYWLRLMSAQLMSLTVFKKRDVSVQLFVTLDVCAIDFFDIINLSTLFQGKYKVIAETCQMPMNYVFCDEKNMDVYWRYSVFVHFRRYLNVYSSSLRDPMMFLFRWTKWTIVSHWLHWFKLSS